MIPVSKPYIPPESISLLNQVVSSNQFSYGPVSKQFEKELADYFGCEYVLLTSSGTTALHLALVSLGVGQGINVVVPNLTFVATANAVRYCNANVVLSDVSLDDWCLDRVYVNSLSSDSIKINYILPVDLYGVSCKPVLLPDVPLVYDSCESFKLGLGIASVFSFYGNKIISCGEGGAIATNDPSLFKRMYHLRGQAMSNERYFHDDVGYNYRITEMQSALGLGQLRVIEGIMYNRRNIIDRYHENLKSYISSDPCSRESSAPWLYTFQLRGEVSKSDRDDLISFLLSHDIDTRPCFAPIHRMTMYNRDVNSANDTPLLDRNFPASCLIADRSLSLPTWTGLSLSIVDKISALVVEWMEVGGRNRNDRSSPSAE